jgi:hypothetical protein
MKNVSYKSCRENHNRHVISNNFFLENRTFYEIMWKNTVDPGRPDDNIAAAYCMLDI